MFTIGDILTGSYAKGARPEDLASNTLLQVVQLSPRLAIGLPKVLRLRSRVQNARGLEKIVPLVPCSFAGRMGCGTGRLTPAIEERRHKVRWLSDCKSGRVRVSHIHRPSILSPDFPAGAGTHRGPHTHDCTRYR